MKIVVLGDTHFGGGYKIGKIDPRKQWNSRLIDFSNTFDYVVNYIIENNVQHFVITGDIFEHRRPSSVELSLFAHKMQRLSELGIFTHIVVGNHDMIIDQKSTTIDVLANLKLPYVRIYQDLSSVGCTDGSGKNINLLFLPFKTRKTMGCQSNHIAIERLASRLQYELRGISTDGPKILIGHLMVEGTKLGGALLESNATELVLPLKMFDGLDATIMGHVHPHHIIRQNPLVAYVGSMERKGFDEGKHQKLFLIIESTNNDLTFKFEELRPVRNLLDIVIDQVVASNCNEATSGAKEYLTDYARSHRMIDAIVRVTIHASDCSSEINTEELKYFMYKELGIHNCVGMHVDIVSSRQLRKDTITERENPEASFIEYLDLVSDDHIKEKMKEFGLRIIRETAI